MDKIRIALGKRSRKKNARSMAITPSAVAALRAMRRYGRITIDQCAAAGSMSQRRARGLIKRLESVNLVNRLVVGASFAMGCLPHLIGLTAAGNRFLIEAEADDGLPLYVPPAKSIIWHSKMLHKLATISSLIAAERDIPHGFHFNQILAEFRKDERGGQYATRVVHLDGAGMKPDAVLTVGRMGEFLAQMIEVDMGSESIVSLDPRYHEKSILAKTHAYWRYLASGQVTERFRVTTPLFQVLFVVKDKTGTPEGNMRRAKSMIDKIDWSYLMPIKGIGPADVFLFTSYDAALANFYGRHWMTPGRNECCSPLATEVITDVAA